MERWSRLTQALVRVLDRVAPQPLSDQDRDLVEALVAEYELGGPTPPDWMVEVLGDIVSRNVSRKKRCVPDEPALACVLEGIQEELFPLGVDDYGEHLTWPLPAFGVRLVVIRETSAPGSLVHLERLKR